MKKKLLLFIPALLALSACGGTNPKVAEPATFLEDTAAHTELFGNAEEAKPIRRNAETITEPSIGYQLRFTEDGGDGKLAIRFYALINELATDIVATWSRGVAGADGTDLNTGKGFDDELAPTTKYYTYLEGVGTAPKDKGYVVYSLYNIPYTEINRNAYVAAYLTLTDTESHEAKSKVLAVKIDCGDEEEHTTSINSFSFYPDEYASGKHFLQGTINDQRGITLSYENPPTGDYASYYDLDLKTTDSFGSFYYSSDTFLYFGYTKYFSTTSSHFSETGDNSGYNTPKEDGRYNLYLSSYYKEHEVDNRNKVYSTKLSNSSARTYIWNSEHAWDDECEIFAWVYGGSVEGSGTWSKVTKIDLHTGYVDVKGATGLNLVRFPKNTESADWSITHWNQTSDASVNDRLLSW